MSYKIKCVELIHYIISVWIETTNFVVEMLFIMPVIFMKLLILQLIKSSLFILVRCLLSSFTVKSSWYFRRWQFDSRFWQSSRCACCTGPYYCSSTTCRNLQHDFVSDMLKSWCTHLSSTDLPSPLPFHFYYCYPVS